MIITAFLAMAILGVNVLGDPPSVPPRRAPAAFVTPEKGLVVPVPPHAFYCPLPTDWAGSDHGTTIFLARPRRCAREIGFPSSARGFIPANTPRVDLFYAYYEAQDGGWHPSCHRPNGRVRLLGEARPLCRKRRGRIVELATSATYRADSDVLAMFTLTTTALREKAIWWRSSGCWPARLPARPFFTSGTLMDGLRVRTSWSASADAVQVRRGTSKPRLHSRPERIGMTADAASTRRD